MQHSREKVVDLILNAVDFDRARSCTTESVIQYLRQLKIVVSSAFIRAGSTTLQWSWTENDVRVLIAELIAGGRMDMDSTGRLSIVEGEDPNVEKFQGSWYATKNGRVLGPFKTKGEAASA